ncbi:MAG TPA: hypothetical protein VKT77_19100 [Chthonomonadaceae bacterium]|nr:hypothetical protein [Chthonomonadaceae bacterium]
MRESRDTRGAADGGPGRPQVSLDGEWLFRFGDEPAQPMPVPGPWESLRHDLINRAGTGTYERTFTLPETFAGKRVVLRFGASDYYTEAFVNGAPVGVHEGGYTPFEFGVDEALRSRPAGAEHSIVVRVTDSTMSQDATLPGGRPLPFAEIPHGKQSWYTSVGGLWQSVWLEARPQSHIRSVTCLPDIDRGLVTVTIEIAGTAELDAARSRVHVAIAPPPGAQSVHAIVAELARHEDAGEDRRTVRLELPVPGAALWSPDSPALYTTHVTLERDGAAVDGLTKRFGMRKVEAREGRVWLNNRPIFLAGALDQDFYPRAIYTPPSESFLRDQFVKAKELGLNLLRCHIKVPAEAYLDLCDEIGLLVWYELPNGKTLSAAFRERARATVQAMWRRDASHPCIIALSIINESWGIDLTDPEQREWLRDTYRWAKQAFPGWLVIDNSPCIPNFHLETDLDDYHIYYNIPDQARAFADWLDAFVEGKGGTYSAYGDAGRRGGEPLVLSEFGNWGLPGLDAVLEAEGGEPYWFKTGSGPTRPEGVLERFHRQGLDRAFRDYEALAEASQQQQWLSLKWQIEEMRRNPRIAGYVITEFTDVNWECNGLLDMGRGRKSYHERMRDVQAQDVLIPRLSPRAALWEGESARIDIAASTIGGADLTHGTVDWSVEGIDGLRGTEPIGGGQGDEAGPRFFWPNVAAIGLVAPRLEAPSKHEISLTLRDASGAIIARNTQNIVFVPAERRRAAAPVPLWTHDSLRGEPGWPRTLESMGYRLAQSRRPDACAIAAGWDPELARFVQEGGRAVLIASDANSIPRSSGLGIGLADRSANGWWGDWCTTKTWFATDKFPSLPDTARFDFEFQAIVPKRVLTGIQPDSAVAGLFAGWLHNPAALVARLSVGAGTLIVTTFDLLPHAGEDPIATLLLGDLIALAVTGA